MKRYAWLASKIAARSACKANGNDEWLCRHEDAIEADVKNTAPSGAGIDNGTHIDLDASTADKLVFTAGYHHMNDGGYYDGWTEHTITVRPSLAFGFTLSISGRDRNDIKDYLHETYQYWLSQEVEEYAKV